MFKGWSSWLGGESGEKEEKTDEQEAAEEENINTETEETQHILQQARGLSGDTNTRNSSLQHCVYHLLQY